MPHRAWGFKSPLRHSRIPYSHKGKRLFYPPDMHISCTHRLVQPLHDPAQMLAPGPSVDVHRQVHRRVPGQLLRLLGIHSQIQHQVDVRDAQAVKDRLAVFRDQRNAGSGQILGQIARRSNWHIEH